jgi:hypothetical protein
VLPAARASARQRGWAKYSFLGAGATVQGTQLYGWSPHCRDFHCSCFVIEVRLSQHHILGTDDYSAVDSAVWLVPSLVISTARAKSLKCVCPNIPSWALATTV